MRGRSAVESPLRSRAHECTFENRRCCPRWRRPPRAFPLVCDQLLQDLIRWLELAVNGSAALERVEPVGIVASRLQPVHGLSNWAKSRLIRREELAKLLSSRPFRGGCLELLRHPGLVPLLRLPSETLPFLSQKLCLSPGFLRTKSDLDAEQLARCRQPHDPAAALEALPSCPSRARDFGRGGACTRAERTGAPPGRSPISVACGLPTGAQPPCPLPV